MFVLYIYFTRIVVYILRITLPPHLTWVDELRNMVYYNYSHNFQGSNIFKILLKYIDDLIKVKR